ncbi:glycoside hydrolase [candidate division KSB3 bacterium]|uniref:Glycoside hydrolase n=1 Tax=candidate division KSB3 bacterium TaxID=2044937 RepID=A0A2G6E8I6_9BACT|nr:MAG: glycoside hydrolase [candidate division KSB3 bacterium]PIE30658.1 MAG: glycoside hydrolase [candidate division KSB3 bacterium]
MLKKSYSSTGKFCRVTFRVPAEFGAETAALCGDFNNWNTEDKPMRLLKNGDFSATVSLEANKSYRFRYLLDGERWENDDQADNYIPNDYGSDDSVVEL